MINIFFKVRYDIFLNNIFIFFRGASILTTIFAVVFSQHHPYSNYYYQPGYYYIGGGKGTKTWVSGQYPKKLVKGKWNKDFL